MIENLLIFPLKEISEVWHITQIGFKVDLVNKIKVRAHT